MGQKKRRLLCGGPTARGDLLIRVDLIVVDVKLPADVAVSVILIEQQLRVPRTTIQNVSAKYSID